MLQLWARQTAAPSNHADLAAACASFEQQHPADAFVPLVRTMSAWHLLQLGQAAASTQWLACVSTEATNTLGQGAALLSRAWLTRMDRERVRAGLQFFYRKEIRYPRSLVELASYKKLPADMASPDQDRWGNVWRYRLVGFKTMPGLEDQKYELLSGRLGEGSDLKAALARPYGDGIRAKPVRVVTTAIPGREVMEVSREAEPALALTAGREDQPLFLAYVGRRLVVLCDSFHWVALPRPPGP